MLRRDLAPITSIDVTGSRGVRLILFVSCHLRLFTEKLNDFVKWYGFNAETSTRDSKLTRRDHMPAQKILPHGRVVG